MGQLVIKFVLVEWQTDRTIDRIYRVPHLHPDFENQHLAEIDRRCLGIRAIVSGRLGGVGPGEIRPGMKIIYVFTWVDT